MLILAAACFVFSCVVYDIGYRSGVKSVPITNPPEPVERSLNSGDFPDTDAVVFGRYCLMEHQPWNNQSYVVYPYDAMHSVHESNCDGPAFYFTNQQDALDYMDIYDQRAERFQRRDNLLNNLEADFGIPEVPKPFDWDTFIANLDDEEGIEIKDIGNYDPEETLS